MVCVMYLECGHLKALESEIVDGREISVEKAPERTYCEECEKTVEVVGEDASVSTFTLGG